MRSPYVADKTFEELDHRWCIWIKNRFVTVFVWKTLAGLRTNARFGGHTNYVGAYIGIPDRKKREGPFGEVHLLKEKIGAGYVAHELQHLVFDFFCDKGTFTNEPMAYLMGDVTTQFWNSFYEFYDVAPSADGQLIPDDRNVEGE